MSPLEILAAVGLAATALVLAYIALAKPHTGNPWIAGTLSAAFGGYSLYTIAKEGLLPVWINHTSNLWGVQVWWDLLLSVGIALFFIAPRARAQGMNILPWIVLVAATASIGLLAMIARLFWLENAKSAQ